MNQTVVATTSSTSTSDPSLSSASSSSSCNSDETTSDLYYNHKTAQMQRSSPFSFSSSSSSSSSNTPTSFDYHADCSQSKTIEALEGNDSSSSSDGFVMSCAYNKKATNVSHASVTDTSTAKAQLLAGDYIHLWEMCIPFFTSFTTQEDQHLQNNATAAAAEEDECVSCTAAATHENKLDDFFWKSTTQEACTDKIHQPSSSSILMSTKIHQVNQNIMNHNNHRRSQRYPHHLESSSSSISSSVDESSHASSVAAKMERYVQRLRESMMAARRQRQGQLLQLRKSRGNIPPPPVPPYHLNHQDHPPSRSKVVSSDNNTGSGGSNRAETNSTESNSNSGGDEEERKVKGKPESSLLLLLSKNTNTCTTDEHILSSQQLESSCQNRHQRLAVKKRKRLDQRREYEEAEQQQSLYTTSTPSSSSSASTTTQESDTATVKYFKPVGHPITLDEALSFTHMARVVVLSVSPFLVVHANAAFYRLTGIVSSCVVVNQPLFSLISLPDTLGCASNIMSDGVMPLNKEQDSILLNQELKGFIPRITVMSDTMNIALNSLFATCGHGNVLPVHIFASQTTQKKSALLRNQDHTMLLRSESTSNEASTECHTRKEINETKAVDPFSCYMSIRPVIRDGLGTKTYQKRSNTQSSSCFYSNVADETISHYVIHMKMKDEGASRGHYKSTMADINLKSDTESCYSAASKPVLTCA